MIVIYEVLEGTANTFATHCLKVISKDKMHDWSARALSASAEEQDRVNHLLQKIVTRLNVNLWS